MTGGTGLIGRTFICHYKQHDYVVLTRSIASARELLPKAVICIEDLTSLGNLDDFDAVINLAGEPIIDKRWTVNQKDIICQSRWQITQELVDLFAVSKQPPAVFLSGSAIGIYPDQADDVITESTPLCEKSFPTKLCMQWEFIASQAEPFTRVVYLRTGIVLSTQGGALAKLLLPFKFFLGGKLGDGKHYMSWIHYLDVIKAIAFLLEDKNIGGAVNLVAPRPETNSEFTRCLAESLNRVAFLTMPARIMRFLLGESSCLLLDSQKVVPQKLMNSDFVFSFSNLRLAFDNLLINKSR
jgi:uncharacterized protein (TIGR01777 family)